MKEWRTNLCAPPLKKGKEKKNCLGTFPGSWHGYQANSPECKSSCWNHPSVHFLSPLLLQPESRGMLQSIPAVLGWRRGYTPDKPSVHRGASQRDKLPLALTDHFKLPVGEELEILEGCCRDRGRTRTQNTEWIGTQTRHHRGKKRTPARRTCGETCVPWVYSTPCWSNRYEPFNPLVSLAAATHSASAVA